MILVFSFPTYNFGYRYSPTILLLRHFDVLSNLVSHEGSAHEQLGVNLEVASVIKEFTEPVGDEDLHFEENSKGDDVSTIHCYVLVFFFFFCHEPEIHCILH